MFCVHCRAELPDSAQFCGKCGQRVAPSNTDTQQQRAPQASAGFARSEEVLNRYQEKIVAQSGILGSSFGDLVRSPKWFKNIFLLALLRFIPIYNLASFGRIAQFGVGNSEGLGQLSLRDMDKNTFKAGLASILGGLFYVILASAFLWLLWPLPFIGLIIWLVLLIFLQAWLVLSVARSVVSNKLVAGLDISEIFSATTKHKGQLLLAVWIPLFVKTIISLLLYTILFIACIAMVSFMGDKVLDALKHIPNPSFSEDNLFVLAFTLIGAVAGFLAVLVSLTGIFSFIIGILDSFFAVFTDCWMYRAVGRWIEKHAPHWKE